MPTGLSGDERLKAVLLQALDHVNLHATAWPVADRNGNFVPPPDAHVLRELAHVNNLADKENLLVHPRLGTVGVMTQLHECDFCYEQARYDAVIKVGKQRRGASLCGDEYEIRAAQDTDPLF